jgi:hypothetical protein
MNRNPERVRAWLISMTKQGEDNVWRGAEKALHYLDALVAEHDGLYSLAKANNQLAKMNGSHRDEWRAKAARYADALEAIAVGEIPGDPNQPHSMLMVARKMALEALCDSDASLAEDAKRLSPEGVAARAEGIAQGDPA